MAVTHHRRYAGENQLTLAFLSTIPINLNGCELCGRTRPRWRRLCPVCGEAIARTFAALDRWTLQRERERLRLFAACVHVDDNNRSA